MSKIFAAPVVYKCGHIALATYGEPKPWAPDGEIKYLDCVICKNLELENKIKDLQRLQTGLQVVLNKDSETSSLDLLSEVARLFDNNLAIEDQSLILKVQELENKINTLRNDVLEEVAIKMDNVARLGSAKLVRKMKDGK